MTKKFGIVLFIISCLSFGLILVVPWLFSSAGKIAGIITGLVIVGEITFYSSIALLGKEYYTKYKSRLMFWKKKPSDSNQINPPG
ncbi:MAG: transporter suffix domain-containing protein [Cyclobacteriaceae bacterium]|nr:transporter suffix domain-containing protein [Cyclobacteriaceae bacterium]